MVRKRFVFVKDFSNVAGGIINKGTTIDIVGQNIFMESNTFGGQVIDPYMYESLHKFIEDQANYEARFGRPDYLHEIPVPYNKA
jgi:hypothetical protein